MRQWSMLFGALSLAAGTAVAAAFGQDGRHLSTAAFVHEVARSQMYEVRAAKFAQSRAASTAVVQFAAEIIKAHDKSAADLKDALSQAGLSALAPEGLDVTREGLLGDLRASGGDEFDRRYIGQQITAQQATLHLAETYASSGDSPALRWVASEMVSQLSQTLGRARELPSP